METVDRCLLQGNNAWQRGVAETGRGGANGSTLKASDVFPVIAEQAKGLELNHDEESVAAVQLQFRKLVGRANLGRSWKLFQRHSGENRKSTSRDERNPGRSNCEISNPDNQRQ